MLQILDPGFLTTVQDGGRYGYQALGVPVSGAMDWFALRAANALAGNPADAAVLEFAPGGLTLQAGSDCLLALTGRGFRLEVDGRRLPPWMAVFVRRGWLVRVTADAGAGWGYLAVAGGLALPPVLGSRATYLRGGFGGYLGRALRAGDILVPGRSADAAALIARAGRDLQPPAFYNHSSGETASLAVIPGPQADWFTDEGLAAFYGSEYSISPLSDRMGYRLEGAAIPHRPGTGELLSEGVVFGAVQVPADGKPIILMADRQTAGGYPKPAVVATADLPALAQTPPGAGRVRFRQTTVTEAQARLREVLSAVNAVYWAEI